jgi:hypothetical protein
MRELSILLVVMIMGFIYLNFVRKNIHLELIESSVNNQKYYVRKLPDAQEASDKLAKLSVNLHKLVDTVKNQDKEGVKKLADNFNSDIITENIPGSMYVAYSVNKGDELSICIRDKDTEKFIDDNTIIFVAIHELAHIMTNETGHTPKFWNNMKYLLEEGNKIGIYEIIDYSENPIMYCGQEINSTPINLN